MSAFLTQASGKQRTEVRHYYFSPHCQGEWANKLVNYHSRTVTETWHNNLGRDMQPGTRDDLISSLNRELFTQSVESLALTARQITRWVIHCRSTMAKHCAMYASTFRTFLIRNEGRPHFLADSGTFHPTSGSRVQIAWRTTLRRHTAAYKSCDGPHEVYI